LNHFIRITLASIILLAATSPARASFTVDTIVNSDATHIASAYVYVPTFGLELHRVVYRDGDTHELKMASSTKTTGAWSAWYISTIAPETAHTPAIEISKDDGTTFIAYQDGDGDLMLAYLEICLPLANCPGLQQVPIDQGTTRGQYPSLTLVYNDNGELDQIHTAAIEGDPQAIQTNSARVRHSYCDSWPNCESNNDWTSADAPMGKPGPYKTAIGNDHSGINGSPLVRIYATMGDGVRVTNWSIYGPSYSNSTTLLTTRRGHLSYGGFNTTGRQLSIATGTDVYFLSGLNGSGTAELVSASGQGGAFSDVTFDSNDFHVVAFNRDTNDDVIIGRRHLSGSSWSRISIPDAGSVGRYVTVHEDQDRDLLIVYRDGTNDRIRIARGD
jgi:hypothetical protein